MLPITTITRIITPDNNILVDTGFTLHARQSIGPVSPVPPRMRHQSQASGQQLRRFPGQRSVPQSAPSSAQAWKAPLSMPALPVLHLSQQELALLPQVGTQCPPAAAAAAAALDGL